LDCTNNVLIDLKEPDHKSHSFVNLTTRATTERWCITFDTNGKLTFCYKMWFYLLVGYFLLQVVQFTMNTRLFGV